MPKKKNSIGKHVIIEWLDTQTHYNCQDNLDKCGLAEAETSGWIVAEDKDSIKIAHTHYKSDNVWSDVTVIPRPNVVRVREG